MQDKALNRAGFTLPELLLYVSVLSIGGIWLAGQFGNVTAGADLERANTEIEKVRTAASSFRSSPSRGGSYTDVTVTLLESQGYNVQPLSDGDDENVYGKDITIVSAESGADATLTYEAGTENACQQLIERYTDTPGIKSAPTCDGVTLTLTLD